MSQQRERRQFGRRTTSILAWIVVAGRPRLPCLVRNLTVAGAFCEMEPPAWLPLRIELLLNGQLIPCELRHTSRRGIGITFYATQDESDDKRDRSSLSNITDVLEWTASPGRHVSGGAKR